MVTKSVIISAALSCVAEHTERVHTDLDAAVPLDDVMLAMVVVLVSTGRPTVKVVLAVAANLVLLLFHVSVALVHATEARLLPLPPPLSVTTLTTTTPTTTEPVDDPF